jgi:hypothetical protein
MLLVPGLLLHVYLMLMCKDKVVREMEVILVLLGMVILVILEVAEMVILVILEVEVSVIPAIVEEEAAAELVEMGLEQVLPPLPKEDLQHL